MLSMATAGLLKYSNKTIAEQEYSSVVHITKNMVLFSRIGRSNRKF